MPNKSFSLYNLKESLTVDSEDQLILEVGKGHIACVLKGGGKNLISAFELFDFKEEEAVDFKKLFNIISADSKLLASPHKGAKVFINSPQCIPVPIFTFSKGIAEDYLNLLFAADPASVTLYEHVAVEPGIMNVFRYNKIFQQVLNLYLPGATYHHTYSNIIRSAGTNAARLAAEVMYVNFYNAFIIVTVVKAEKLQLIQTFVYETPDDVLYHLLNIVHRLHLNFEVLKLQVSGMIDLDFVLYQELVKYFKEVIVENVEASNLAINFNEHPLHYFTPFCNLAL